MIKIRAATESFISVKPEEQITEEIVIDESVQIIDEILKPSESDLELKKPSKIKLKETKKPKDDQITTDTDVDIETKSALDIDQIRAQTEIEISVKPEEQITEEVVIEESVQIFDETLKPSESDLELKKPSKDKTEESKETKR